MQILESSSVAKRKQISKHPLPSCSPSHPISLLLVFHFFPSPAIIKGRKKRSLESHQIIICHSCDINAGNPHSTPLLPEGSAALDGYCRFLKRLGENSLVFFFLAVLDYSSDHCQIFKDVRRLMAFFHLQPYCINE